jgi:hypothetical protein
MKTCASDAELANHFAQLFSKWKMENLMLLLMSVEIVIAKQLTVVQ